MDALSWDNTPGGATSSATAASCAYCDLPMTLRAAAADEPAYCCYGCRFAAMVAQASGSEARLNWIVTRLGLSIFLCMGVMVFTLFLYSQELYAAGNETTVAQSDISAIMRYCSLLFTAPVLLLLGVPIAGNAWRQLRHGQLSTDSLIVLGVAAAFIHSYISTLAGHGQTYYETTCMILILVTVGRWLEASHRHQASETLSKMAALLPDRASIKRGDEIIEVDVTEIQSGDLVIVHPGQRSCVDGVIVQGSAYVDESLISGESAAISRQPGDDINAGVVPQDGTLAVRASRVGQSSSIGRFAALLEAARRSRGRFERLADRIAMVFIPCTGVLSGVGFILGFQRGGMGEAIMTGLAVVLIACPCALGIATPLAVWAAMSRAASKRILIRGATTLERLATVRHICFDKTGTLTTGTPIVTGLLCQPPDARDALIDAARQAAEMSSHAVARSIARWTQDHGARPAELGEASTVGGRGVRVTCAGRTMLLGNEAFVVEGGMSIPVELVDTAHEALRCGQVVCFVAMNGGAVGLFTLSESIRDEALPALEQLKTLGCALTILTGDASRRAATLARRCAIGIADGLTPSDKIDYVQALRRRAAVAMVGDGLNDAPALSAADVGLAMGCGADLTRESADACLISDDLGGIPWLVHLAQHTVRTIRVNLFWAFAYNAVGIGLALAGVLSPIFAAVAMVLSSVVVVSNSLRPVKLAGEAGGDA